MKETFLFLDDSGLEFSSVSRLYRQPSKRAAPLIHNAANFSCTVHRANGLWHMWYIASEDEDSLHRYTAHTVSSNGTAWADAVPLPETLHDEFSDILPEPNGTYKGYRPLDGPGPRWKAQLVSSADGMHWQYGLAVTEFGYGENWQPYKVGIGYALAHRWNIKDYSWVDSGGVIHTNTAHDPTFVRCLGLTTSPDPAHFPPSSLLFAPGPQDDGETQFYSAGTIFRAGQYYLMPVHILRDDLIASNVKPGAYGKGHTILAYSIDGLNWTLDRRVFLGPNPTPGKWDHAVAWADGVVTFSDYVWFFYGGYAHGHKIFTDRKIGLAKLRRDRFVGINGLARTKPFKSTAKTAKLNLHGSVKVDVLDMNNQRIATSPTVTADALNRSTGLDLSPFLGSFIKLEFTIQNGELYAYHLM